ncbi:MAG: DNA repair protein RecO [Saprospiraceae bacterium]|nr:DNA repair protein RecO [Saprospiraceae bacterium]
MLLSTKGIVIRTVKYAETSLILEIFTEQKGMRSYIIGGVRTQKSKTKNTALQPMSLVELVAYDRDDKSINRIKEIKSAFIYTNMAFDFKRAAVGLFMIEVAKKAIKEASPNEHLCNYLIESFKWLDQCDSFANLHLSFMIHLSYFLGFMPEPFDNSSSKQFFFDLKEGQFSSEQPLNSYALDPEYASLLNAIITTPYNMSHTIHLSRSQRQLLLHKIIVYYQLHLDYFTEPNTHHILKEVLE